MLTDDQRKANRLALAYKDMEDVIRFLDAYDELSSLQAKHGTGQYSDHCEGLLMAAIVSYCRPFMTNRGREHADTQLVASTLDSVTANKSVHELIKYKRDKFVAHADWEERKTEIIKIEGDSVYRRFPMPSVTDRLDITEFRTLANAVMAECRFNTYDLDRGTDKHAEGADNKR